MDIASVSSDCDHSKTDLQYIRWVGLWTVGSGKQNRPEKVSTESCELQDISVHIEFSVHNDST